MAFINVAEWSAENVADWLKGLEDCILPYVSFFLNNNVNGCRLLLLTADDLVNLNVHKKGHQEIILEGVDLLKQLHYNFTTETLQSQALKLGCKSRSLFNQLRQDEEESAAADAAAAAAQAKAAALSTEKTSKKNQHKQQLIADAKNTKPDQTKRVEKVSTSTLIAVSEIVLSVKQFISWIDRYPFSSQDMYLPIRKVILCHSIELASTAQRDHFADAPNKVIKAACLSLADLCDRIVQDVNDSLAISPASLEVVAIKKMANEDLGLQVYSSFNNSGIHIVGWIKRGSPSDRCSRIEEGDEIVQIRYQTVVGWLQSKLVTAMKESPTQVLLTLKKRPRHHPAPGRFEVMKPQKLPVPRQRPHIKTHSTRRTTATVNAAAVAAAAASASAANAARADPDSEDEGFETSYKQTQLKGPVFPGYRKPRHPVRRRATISGTSPAAAAAQVAIRIDDLVPNSVKGATSASPIHAASASPSHQQQQHQHNYPTSGSSVSLMSRNQDAVRCCRREQVLARSASHDVSSCGSTSTTTTAASPNTATTGTQMMKSQPFPSGRESFNNRKHERDASSFSGCKNNHSSSTNTGSSNSLSMENKASAATTSPEQGATSTKTSATTTIPTVIVQHPSPEKAVSDGYMSGSVPSSSRSPSSSSSSPSTSSQISASGSSDLLPTIEKMGSLSIDRSKQYKELVGFNLAALRCKQRGPSHNSSLHNSSTLKSTTSADSDENSTHSANSDTDIFTDSVFRQMKPKGPTPPPHRKPQVPRRRATISGASSADLPPPPDCGNKESALTDKSDTDSGKGPSTTPPASTIPSPTVRGIISSTLTRIQESVSRSRDQNLARSNSHTSAASSSSGSGHEIGLHSLDYLFQTPPGRQVNTVPWLSEAPVNNRTLFAVSRNTSPPEKSPPSPAITTPAPLILSSFRPPASASPTTSAHLPRAKVVPLPPTEKPPPPPAISLKANKETVPKSVMYMDEMQKSQKKEFHLKDPFRDPFASDLASELHYVDVDVNLEETGEKKAIAPVVKSTIYHQLLNGVSTPLSTRPAIGVVIPNHSSEVPKSTPSVISCHLKSQTATPVDPDIPPPLPLRSAGMMPAPKVTPRASLMRKAPAPDPLIPPELPLRPESMRNNV